MANFIIVVDPEPERRTQFITRIEPFLPPVEGLITNSCAIGNFHASWAATPQAPISWVADSEGAAVIWGEAIPQAKSARIDASALKSLCNSSGDRTFPAFDGFYAAVVYHSHTGITVGADLAGIFPIYYYTHGEVAIVGSSPELFQYHPLFQKAFNPVGLVGILMTNGLVNGETLWQDVRRLASGHLLTWQPESSPKEIKHYQIPAFDQDNRYATLSFSEQLDIVEQVLDQALVRHAPTEQHYCLLLSGGLDSRMLAGYLHQRGVNLVTLTRGIPNDIEMECAVSVARQLGLEQHTEELEAEQYPAYADLFIKWEHLANGFHWFMNWSTYSYLRNLAPRVITGQSLDRLIGGSWDYTYPNETLSFDILYSRLVNSWGFSPQVLGRLLRKEVFGDLVQETLTGLRTLYNSYSDNEIGRTWWFDFYHRQRFNSGSAIWQLSFGAWPTQPFLDWQMLETTAAMPLETMSKRRAQNALLCTRFPQLAQLPLDRNDYNVEPLQPTRTRRRLAKLFELQRKWRQLQQKLGYERRYYYRIQDINNPGWQSVRQQAEPQRKQVSELFHEEVLDELLPKASVPVRFQGDAITGASARKAIVGFLLWSKDHL